jgi:radical SAM protein with 4Fe4S-binding SPASM domain
LEFKDLTFILTDECNFRCTYCPQRNKKKYLDLVVIDRALVFFPSYLHNPCYINFYGGEPLLGFYQAKYIVDCLDQVEQESNRKFLYSITTNGSLIDDEVLRFFDHHRFSVMISFDGLAQDISRQKGSFDRIVPIIKELLDCPNAKISVNSVFTPETVGLLSKSLQFIMEMAVPNIDFTVSAFVPWDESSILKLESELEDLRRFSLKVFEETDTIPVNIFRESMNKILYSCDAGQNRMVLSPDGKLWGCPAFHDYFSEKENTQEYLKYSFGDLDDFIHNHQTIYPEILKNHSFLCQKNYFTSQESCKDCSYLEGCDACPIYSAFSTSKIGKIADWVCQIKKIFRRERKAFRDDLIDLKAERFIKKTFSGRGDSSQ